MSVVESQIAVRQPGFISRSGLATLRYFFGIVLCLHPVTAIIALGWLTRRMRCHIATFDGGEPALPMPGILMLNRSEQPGIVTRWIGGLFANIGAGLKALTAVLIFTLPFSALWYLGWFAGWENSFSKGYEQAFFWPALSFGAVVACALVLSLLPMAIAHQAARNRIAAILELRQILLLFRQTPWRNLGLLFMIAIGFAALLAVRALPTFASHLSERVAEGQPDAVAAYLMEVRLAATLLLFTGLLVLRWTMARVYARALERLAAGQRGGTVTAIICYLLSSAFWLVIIFTIFLAQFLNYNWFSWLNQPVLMLPWLGSLA